MVEVRSLAIARYCYLSSAPATYLRLEGAMPKQKLTIRSVEAIAPGERDIILWDTDVPGFGCKVTPTGRRSYFVYYRTREGDQRRPALGVHGAIKPEKAREAARAILAEVALGKDPAKRRTDARKTPTVAELAERYVSEYATRRKKASSMAEDRRLIAKIIVPAIGTLKVDQVGRLDVRNLHSRLADRPISANRVVALLSSMFAQAEGWGLRPEGSNPVRGVEKYKERRRDRFLSAEEMGRLTAALEAYEAKHPSSRSAVLAIRLLTLTGCRLGEIRTLQWKHVDLPNRVIRLPDSKTGAKTVYLSTKAAGLLSDARGQAPSAVFVCEGRKQGECLVNLQKPWRRIRAMAGLDDVRIHDLRHSYASLGVQAGLSLPMIGKLLGHKDVATTARYAHLADDPLRKSAEEISRQMMAGFAALADRIT
jgi:integrase